MPHIYIEMGDEITVDGRFFQAIIDGVQQGLRDMPGRPMAVKGEPLVRLAQTEGLYEDPGMLVPGHSPALQVVSVNTAKGTAIIGSDSATIARSYKEDWPSCITIDLLASLKSYDKSLDAIQ